MNSFAHPQDPKFEFSLWTRTSEYVHKTNFDYIATERILDNLSSERLLENVDGFLMCPSLPISELKIRDDPFININKDKKNILFAGCSMTYGTGLEVGERWIDKVYKTININSEYSGLFNLGQAGDGLQSQIDHIFEYCSLHGMPDTICINIPDFWRLKNDRGTYKVYSGINNDYSISTLGRFVYSIGQQAYSLLEMFYMINKINLIAFSWDRVTNIALKDFQSFSFIDNEEFEKLVFKYDDKTEYSMIARDNLHPGTASHLAWAEIVLDKLFKIL